MINIRLANCENIDAVKLLDEILNNDNLTDEYITTILRRKRDSEYVYREKINNKIYDDSINLETTNNHIIKYARRQNPKNSDKIERIKEENLLKNLKTVETMKFFAKEKKMNIILDNYASHHSWLVEDVCKILNINLIFLPPASPDLNPIEDVWNHIKDQIYNDFIEDAEDLGIKFEKLYYEEVKKESYYENWVIEYLA